MSKKPRYERTPALGLIATLTLALAIGTSARAAPPATPSSVTPSREITTTTAARVEDDFIRRSVIHRALGAEKVAVILCIVPHDSTHPLYASLAHRGHLDVYLSPSTVADIANRHITPYFTALSRGRYTPTFHAQGAIQLETDEGPHACHRKARILRGSTYSSFLAVDTSRYRGGMASPGISPFVIERDLLTLDGSNHGRGSYVGGGVIRDQVYSTMWHEVGHTLHWPHSFTSASNEYDNPVDLMSARHHLPLAVNVLASGWLDDSHVVEHRSEITSVVIHPLLSGDTEIVIARSPRDPHRFLTIEHRPDVSNGRSGVAVHLVEQNSTGCGFHRDNVCLSVERRHRPAIGPAGSLNHVLTPGRSLSVDGVTIAVIGHGTPDHPDSFTVRIVGQLTP